MDFRLSSTPFWSASAFFGGWLVPAGVQAATHGACAHGSRSFSKPNPRRPEIGRSTAMITRSLCSITMIVFTCGQLLARSGGVSAEDPYDPRHVDDLPPEIRAAVAQNCNKPKAERYFAGYFSERKQIVLHFDRLRCDRRTGFCNQSGCLHQVWVFTEGRYRLLRSYYAPPGD
jgi:hypothetical protein